MVCVGIRSYEVAGGASGDLEPVGEAPCYSAVVWRAREYARHVPEVFTEKDLTRVGCGHRSLTCCCCWFESRGSCPWDD